jgi:hypothetical protein
MEKICTFTKAQITEFLELKQYITEEREVE